MTRGVFLTGVFAILFVTLVSGGRILLAQGTTNESGIAFREIIQLQRFPRAFSASRLTRNDSGRGFQGLARVWTRWSGRDLKASIEGEISALYNSEKIDSVSGSGWGGVSGAADGFKRWILRSTPLSGDHTSVQGSIERFDLSWRAGRWDVDLGRQPISLGTSHFVGILDVIAPFHPGYLDASYKPGVDALRVRTGMGTSGEAEVISAISREPSENALIGRLRRTVSGIDFELLGGRFRYRSFAGLAWEGEKNRITLWGEAGFFQRLPRREAFWGGDSRFALSWVAGLEKEIRPGLKCGIGWMYQDFGVRRAADLSRAAMDSPFTEGWTFLGAARYGILTVHKELDPLTAGDVNLIFNSVDGSSLIQPKVTFNTGDNSDLAVFAWIKAGKRPSGMGNRVVPGSEFGAFPDGIGVIFRRFL